MSGFLAKMSRIDAGLLKSKFRGAMLGSLLGDCLGSPYEGEVISSGEKIVIQRYFDGLESPDLKGPRRPYTDDTAMMKSVAISLANRPEVDYTDMAKHFVKEFYAEPNRGYGQNVVDVFQKLRRNKFDDIYLPAKEQFGGSGSFGNGGAMRVAPVALFFHKDPQAMVDAARKSTQITHTNPLGVHGAILQCLAVHKALEHDPKEPIDTQKFCEELYEKMKEVEKENDDGMDSDYPKPYQDKLREVQRLLKKSHSEDYDETVINTLGNSICAHESVPTALFCFLRAQSEIPTIQTDNVFRRAIQYAISLGGDTDTIACMSGAIAGAYLGEESVNPHTAKQCEFHKETVDLADSLFNTIK